MRSTSLLLSRGGNALRSLAGPRVLLGALAADGQALAVTKAAIAPVLDQPLDAHAHFTAKITLHLEVMIDVLSESIDIRFGKVEELWN